jgi:ornithine decarboxylase
MWTPVLDQIAPLWHRAKAAGFPLEVMIIGGGFPAYHGAEIDAPEPYAAEVMRLIQARFGHVPQIMAEPGRAMVAEAGAIAAEVVLTSRKSADDLHRWVYLDIGLFSGLAEAMDEAIRYDLLTSRDREQCGPCILAGPSCDSADVLYEKLPVQLPLSLKAGDRIVLRNCGAYTTTYASVGFNGFAPLAQVVI